MSTTFDQLKSYNYKNKTYYYEGTSSTGVFKRFGPYNYNEFLDLYIKCIIKNTCTIYVTDKINTIRDTDKYVLNNLSHLKLQLHSSILFLSCEEYVISDELITNCLFLNIGNEYQKLLLSFPEAFTVYV